MVLGFSGTQAAKIVGISYRQLDYWARTDLIRPTAADASGSGSRRIYSYRDLLELRVIKNLLDAGIRLESVREVFAYLRNHVDTDIVAAGRLAQWSRRLECASAVRREGPSGCPDPARHARNGRREPATRGSRALGVLSGLLLGE
ncbi:MAG: hypothetical protein RIQ63_453 [Actinomycetota bacterium]